MLETEREDSADAAIVKASGLHHPPTNQDTGKTESFDKDMDRRVSILTVSTTYTCTLGW